MVYHANSSWLPGGFLGVEVFFVISGYLITLLLIGEHERSATVNLGQFWLRRAKRLLPALYECYNPMPYDGAREMEVELAIALREQGYGVWQA